MIALNSEISMQPGSAADPVAAPGAPGEQDRLYPGLLASTLYSSGPNDNNPDTRLLWSTLIEFGAEVVLNGHDHYYERFERQDADGRPDSVNGLRQFIVGTGGAHLYAPRGVKPNSAVRSGASMACW